VKLTVIGCSPAWPNAGGAHSGYLVESEGRRLLLDCGPGVLARLRQREPWPAVDAIVVTHFHLDHWGDLVPWVWGAMFSPGAAAAGRPELWVHEGGSERLRDLGERLGRADMFSRIFELREYSDRSAFAAAGFELTAYRVPHYSLETYALRVECGGRTLAYSGDSAPTEALVDAARDADLFLCEATLPDEGEEGDRGHLSAPEAAAAAESAGARRLVVVHHPEELDLDPALERAYDGLELSV
jgi:ribonuclease BN (tRNA processing enzyme)